MAAQHLTFGPDFFVVGAAKAGTTAVYHWLKDHPGAFLPSVKEPGYFANIGRPALPSAGPFDPHYVSQLVTKGADYAELYTEAGGRVTGEASPVYLLDYDVASRIAAVRPEARIIILLRDPVDRAFSQFLHHVRDGLEPFREFQAALDAEPERLGKGWSWGHGYATYGHYEQQIERYLAVFPREQVLFLEYQDLQTAPNECWRQICMHLGLQPRPLAHNKRVNATADLTQVSGRPEIARRLKHPGPVQTLLKGAIPANLRSRIRQYLEGSGCPLPKMTPETKNCLIGRYGSERLRIEKQTGLCLKHWAA